MLSASTVAAPICFQKGCRVRTIHTHGAVSAEVVAKVREFSDAIRIGDYEAARRLAEQQVDLGTGWGFASYLHTWSYFWMNLKAKPFSMPFLARFSLCVKEVVRFRRRRHFRFHRPRSRAFGHSYNSPVSSLTSPRLL